VSELTPKAVVLHDSFQKLVEGIENLDKSCEGELRKMVFFENTSYVITLQKNISDDLEIPPHSIPMPGANL